MKSLDIAAATITPPSPLVPFAGVDR